ncbi:MAG: hypothetical protein WCT31_03355 [Candidatus Micrarchaeia archaeon]
MLHAFLREKPARVITTLRNTEVQWHLSKIARETGTTYVYITKFISDLSRRGLVTIASKGKLRIAKLTDRGMEIANMIEELRKKLE